MARNKNALRKHEIAPWTNLGKPTEEDYKELSRWITSITDDTDEEVDDTPYYDGDGTPENDVTSISEIWTVEGTYDNADEAQKMIADMKRVIGEGRKIWHKITYVDGTVVEGPAIATDIVAGGGDAGEYESFGCTLTYSRIPEVTDGTVLPDDEGV